MNMECSDKFREAMVGKCMDQMKETVVAAAAAAAGAGADSQEDSKYDMVDHSKGSLISGKLNALCMYSELVVGKER